MDLNHTSMLLPAAGLQSCCARVVACGLALAHLMRSHDLELEIKSTASNRVQLRKVKAKLQKIIVCNVAYAAPGVPTTLFRKMRTTLPAELPLCCR